MHSWFLFQSWIHCVISYSSLIHWILIIPLSVSLLIRFLLLLFSFRFSDSARTHLLHCCITAFCPIWAFVWLGYVSMIILWCFLVKFASYRRMYFGKVYIFKLKKYKLLIQWISEFGGVFFSREQFTLLLIVWFYIIYFCNFYILEWK